MNNKTNTMTIMREKKRELEPKLRFPEFQDVSEWTQKTIDQVSKNVIAGGTPSTLRKEFWNGNIR